MVARTVLETLRQVTDVVEDTQSVFMILARLGQDVGESFNTQVRTFVWRISSPFYANSSLIPFIYPRSVQTQ